MFTDERDKLFKDVQIEWTMRSSRALQRHNAPSNDNDEDEEEDSSDDIEECIVKVSKLLCSNVKIRAKDFLPCTFFRY